MARHSFKSGIHSSETITMRHLTLDTELDFPLTSSHGSIEMQDYLRENVGEKFRGYIYISVHCYSSEPINTFDVAKRFRDFSDFLCYSEEQVKKLKIKTSVDCREFVSIDVIEVVE